MSGIVTWNQTAEPVAYYQASRVRFDSVQKKLVGAIEPSSLRIGSGHPNPPITCYLGGIETDSSAKVINIADYLVGRSTASAAPAVYWPTLPKLSSYVEIDSLSDADELDEIVRLATARLGW